jgi:hypothetical protein
LVAISCCLCSRTVYVLLRQGGGPLPRQGEGQKGKKQLGYQPSHVTDLGLSPLQLCHSFVVQSLFHDSADEAFFVAGENTTGEAHMLCIGIRVLSHRYTTLSWKSFRSFYTKDMEDERMPDRRGDFYTREAEQIRTLKAMTSFLRRGTPSMKDVKKCRFPAQQMKAPMRHGIYAFSCGDILFLKL